MRDATAYWRAARALIQLGDFLMQRERVTTHNPQKILTAIERRSTTQFAILAAKAGLTHPQTVTAIHALCASGYICVHARGNVVALQHEGALLYIAHLQQTGRADVWLDALVPADACSP